MSAPPDVIGLLLAHFKPLLAVPAVAKRPDGSGVKSFVLLTGTGGPGRWERHMQTVQVTVDSYAATDNAAWKLAAQVDALVHALPESDVPIAAVSWATTPSNFPDPDVGLSRYTATYQVAVKCR